MIACEEVDRIIFGSKRCLNCKHLFARCTDFFAPLPGLFAWTLDHRRIVWLDIHWDSEDESDGLSDQCLACDEDEAAAEMRRANELRMAI